MTLANLHFFLSKIIILIILITQLQLDLFLPSLFHNHLRIIQFWFQMKYPKRLSSLLMVRVTVVNYLKSHLIETPSVVCSVEMFIQSLLVHTSHSLTVFSKETFVIIVSLTKFSSG